MDITEINIENYPDLYAFKPRKNIKKSLAVAKALKNEKISEEIIIHFYWRVPKEFGRKQILPIISTIVTQTQLKPKIWLWSNVDLKTNEYIKPLLPYIELKIWDPVDEIKTTEFATSGIINSQLDDTLCWLGSDLFRLLCLYKYGGIFMDMDMVLLRDLSPLVENEFLYQWANSGSKASKTALMINGAIMRLKKHSKLAREFLEQLIITPVVPDSSCWGRQVYEEVRKKNQNWLVLPCAWFNTEWGLGLKGTFPGFKKKWFVNMYNGAFSWHWHNQWDAKIEKGSKFERIERKMKLLLKAENI